MKKWRNLIIFALTLMLVLGCTVSASAVPAFPGKVPIEDRASGELVYGYLKGDEFFSYQTDEAGRVIEEDEWGCLRYVIRVDERYDLGGYLVDENGTTEPGGTVVMSGEADLQEALTALRQEIASRKPEPMALEEDERSQRVKPHPAGEYVYGVREDDALYGKTVQYPEVIEAHEYASRGENIPLLVVRVEYEDAEGYFSDDAWAKAIFDNGVNAYYKEVSNGKFTYVPAEETGGTPNDGVVTAELPILCPWYDMTTRDLAPGIYTGTDGKDYVISGTPTLFLYAVAAVEDQVDFASYDKDGNGRIDPTELAIVLLLPGNNASVSADSSFIGDQPAAWPHSSVGYTIWTEGDDSLAWQCYGVAVDDVEVFKYTMIAENMGSQFVLDGFLGLEGAEEYHYLTKEGYPVMTPVGTVCHELGHDLGLVDLYPINMPTSQEVGYLSLMANGSWGYQRGELPGSSPVHIEPFGKQFLDFYEETPVEQAGEYELAMASTPGAYQFLWLESDVDQVAYLVENRRFIGFDAGILGEYRDSDLNGEEGGVIVWRLDQDVMDANWYENTVNSEEGRYGLMPLFVRQSNWKNIPFLTAEDGAITLPDAPRIRLRVLEDGETALVKITYCYKVTFDANGGSVEESFAFTDEDGRLERLPVPTRSGNYQFDGWYQDTEDGPEKVTTETVFQTDTQIYAKWYESSDDYFYEPTYSVTEIDDMENGKVLVDLSTATTGDRVTITVTPDEGYVIDQVRVTDANGNELELRDNGNGTYTFTMPDSNVKIKAIFLKEREKTEKPLDPAAVAQKDKIVLNINQKTAVVFGKTVINDAAPMIRNGRTMLPIRFIAESLGAVVTWDQELQKVSIVKGDLVVEVFVDRDDAIVNGKPVKLDVGAFIENNRTYLPLRFVAENLNAAVYWNAATQEVTVVPKDMVQP